MIPTHPKSPYFKRFCGFHLVIDSKMTAKKLRCSAFYGRASFLFSVFGVSFSIFCLLWYVHDAAYHSIVLHLMNMEEF